MNSKSLQRHRSASAFTLMEILVVIAIIITLAAIAYPVIAHVKKNAYKAQALGIMKNLGGAMSTYAQEHDGLLPEEDASGTDDWTTTADPKAEKAWYNALPHVLREKSVGDMVKENMVAAFYTKANFLYLPGAQYPQAKKELKPYFAIAINTKLHRKDEGGSKPELRMANIQLPSRTVAFLEQGLPGEERAHPSIAKKDYDGSCKGSAKSFVARYSGKGVIAFMDGHSEELAGKDILDTTGKILWDVNNKSGIFWTGDPASDPN